MVTMLKYSVSVYSILFSLVRADFNGANTRGTPGVRGADTRLLANAVQGASNENRGECKAALKQAPPPAMDGVSVLPQGSKPQPDYKDVNSCLAAKRNILNNALHVANNYIRSAVSQPVEKPCVYSMNKESPVCYADKVVKGLLSTPIWTVGVHGNVSEVWYKKQLSDMFVMERPRYVIKKANEQCLTFFPDTQLSAVQNGLGNLLSITGSPAKGQSKSSKECSPCGMKPRKTAEGEGSDGPTCADACSPLGLLYNFSDAISTTDQSDKKVKKPKTKKNKKGSKKSGNSSDNKRSNDDNANNDSDS